MTRPALKPEPAPHLLSCPDCGKEVPTKLARTRTQLSPNCWHDAVERVVVSHGCKFVTGPAPSPGTMPAQHAPEKTGRVAPAIRGV